MAKFNGIPVDQAVGPRFKGTPAAGGTFPQPNTPNDTNLLNSPLADFNADVTTGIPGGQRAINSIKVSPQGKIAHLESIYGPGNVQIRSDGEPFVRIPSRSPDPRKQWVKVDEDSLTLRDFADMTGGTIEAGPTVAAGVLSGGNPGAVAFGQAAGSGLRHLLSSVIEGDDQMSLGDRALDVGVKTALAGGTQFVGNKAITPLVDAMRPHNIVAKRVRPTMDTPYAKRGELLQKETGMVFSPGQTSGSRGQIMMEGLARQHPVSADKVMQFDLKQSQQAVKRLNQLMDSIDPSKPGAFETGKRVAGAFDNAVDKSLNARSSQASVDFGKVAELSGNTPVIATNNTRKALQNLIDDFDVPGGGDQTASLVNRLKGLVAEGGNSIPEQMTAKQAQRLLQIYGKAAKGKGQIFKDIDTSQQRMVAGRVFKALQADLDDAAESGGVGGEVAAALKAARDNYRANSQALDALEDNVLGKLLGGAQQSPEALADKFLRMRPSEIRGAMDVLKKADPSSVQAVKRHLLQEAMDSAIPAPSGTNAAGVAFSPSKFNSFIQKHADQFRAMYSPKELVQVKRIYEGLSRIADRAGMEGSQTARLQMVFDVAKAAFRTSPTDIAQAGATIVAPRKIATAMTTEKGRRALITLTQSSGSQKARRAAAAYLSELWALEDIKMRAASTEADVIDAQQIPQQ